MTEINTRSLPDKLTYESALALSMSLADFERNANQPTHSTFHLERMRLLTKLLGNPQSSVPSIHIAGTKGKGSTCAMVSSALSKAGLKVGLTTSPHLHSVTERIRIGFEPISKDLFTNLVRYLWPFVRRVEVDGNYGAPTWFEFMIVAAFQHFQDEKADIQVVETGLGGRLDATNILRPILTSITSISIDHATILGDNIKDIAKEKAGIIKEAVPVIVAPQQRSSDAFNVISEVAQAQNAPLVDVSQSYPVEIAQAGLFGQSICVTGNLSTYKFDLPLLGKYQADNAATAIAVLESLVKEGYVINKGAIEEGLSCVEWPARLEIVNELDPFIVVDGAHNPYSARCLVDAIDLMKKSEMESQGEIILVFGALKNHDCSGILREFLRLDPILIPVSSRHPKAAPHIDIVKYADEIGILVDEGSRAGFENLPHAMEYALSRTGAKDMVLGAGSLSVAAEIIEWKRKIAPELYPGLLLDTVVGKDPNNR